MKPSLELKEGVIGAECNQQDSSTSSSRTTSAKSLGVPPKFSRSGNTKRREEKGNDNLAVLKFLSIYIPSCKGLYSFLISLDNENRKEPLHGDDFYPYCASDATNMV
jgi:hypothetical protein